MDLSALVLMMKYHVTMIGVRDFVCGLHPKIIMSSGRISKLHMKISQKHLWATDPVWRVMERKAEQELEK